MRALRKKRRETILIICPEEKECVRISEILNGVGIASGFYNTRDYTFYNITASHEYEHERLKVLSALLEGDLDAVVTTPDACLGYTIPPKSLKKRHLSSVRVKLPILPSSQKNCRDAVIQG